MNTELRHKKTTRDPLTYLILGIASLGFLLALVLYFRAPDTAPGQHQETAMERIRRTGVLRAGYGGFPPYTIVDLNAKDSAGKVKGFCVDMVNEMANRCVPRLRVEWHNLNWENFDADMRSGKFDFLADGVYATIPKALDFSFTDPFSYFGLCVAVVRKDDNRFNTFEDLNRPDITISYADGYISGDYAKAHLDKPKFKSMVVGKDAFSQLDDVINGRADVAVQDVPTVVQYVAAHKDRVKALWLDHPPTRVAGCFVTRQEDADLLQFLNTSIRVLQVDGTLDRLDKKWNSLAYFEKKEYIPGKGLQ